MGLCFPTCSWNSTPWSDTATLMVSFTSPSAPPYHFHNIQKETNIRCPHSWNTHDLKHPERWSYSQDSAPACVKWSRCPHTRSVAGFLWGIGVSIWGMMLLRLVIYRSPAIAWATVCLTPKISGRFVRSRSHCPWRMVFLWTFRWRCIQWPRHQLPLCIASAPKAPKAHGTTASKSHGLRSSAEPWSTLPTQNPQSWHFLNPPNCTCRIH